MSISSINGNTALQSGSFPPARVASTGSALYPSTGGLLVVDGVQLVAGDRVLCKDETIAVNNGMYAANTGPWVRTSDAATNQQFFSGMVVTIGLGAVNGGQTFICTCPDDPVVVGTSLITFASQQSIANASQSGTSASSFTIGTGSKTFATQVGKAFQINQWVLIQETSAPANQMLGQVTAYAGTSLTVNVTAVGGSGTHSDWIIVLTNSAAAAGYQPPVGSGNVTGPGSSSTGHVATFADATGKLLQDGGAPVGSANTITPSMFASAAVALGVSMLNGQLAASAALGTLTVAVKTLAGNDPSSTDPVFFLFRSATASSGALAVVEVTAALNVAIGGETLGFQNNTPGRLWVVALNDTGGVSLALINCLSGANIFPLAGWGIAMSVTQQTGGLNSPQIFVAAANHTNVPYSVLGYMSWEAPVTMTAGSWVAPSRIDTYRPGMLLPGQEVQSNISETGTLATGTTTLSLTDSIPTNSQGDQYMSSSITPSSSANMLDIEAMAYLSNGTAGATNITMGLFQDSISTALSAVAETTAASGAVLPFRILHSLLAATLSSTTFKVRAGAGGGTNTFNGSAGGRELGGSYNSFMRISERMA